MFDKAPRRQIAPKYSTGPVVSAATAMLRTRVLETSRLFSLEVPESEVDCRGQDSAAESATGAETLQMAA
jgi:hypothetical protein